MLKRGRHSGQSARHPKVLTLYAAKGSPGEDEITSTEEMKAIVEQQMRDETTVIQLLISRGHNRRSLRN